MNKSTVFISYASQDAAVAETVCAALEAAGFPCWIAPRDVRAGEAYAAAIVEAINSCRMLVLLLSQNAIDSPHVLREIERASSKRRPVLAVRLDASRLPPELEYFLSANHWLDASGRPIERSVPALVESVRNHDRGKTDRQTLGTSSPAVGSVSGSLSSPAPTKPSSSWKTRATAATLAVVAVGLGYVLVNEFWLPKHALTEQPATAAAPLAAISDKSIAVLPFVDMSEKHDQEYFSDGLSEELINHLAHISDLKVIARTSSFAFKGKNEDMRTIATKLGVANLLEGSVRRAGGTLRITAQLIRASDGVHLWSETYERRLSDIFKVQDEISTTVAKALNVALNVASTEGVQPASRETTNIEAYNLMLKGNYHYWRSNKGDNARAVEYYRQAINLDPHYAIPWAKLARAFAWQGFSGELTTAEAELKGRDAVQRALAIDPNCAEAYHARGNILRLISGDWTAAISDYERAVALDPHGEVGDYSRGIALILRGEMSGQFGDSIEWARRHLEQNPLDTRVIYALAAHQQLAGQLDESVASSRKLLELNPIFATAQAQYGLTLLLMGKQTEALATAEKESDEASRLQALACIYWAMGRRAESDSALGALEHRFADRNAYLIAAAHAYRSDADAGFAWLERAYQQGKGNLHILKVDPLLRNLRADPRFDALLRKAKLTA